MQECLFEILIEHFDGKLPYFVPRHFCIDFPADDPRAGVDYGFEQCFTEPGADSWATPERHRFRYADRVSELCKSGGDKYWFHGESNFPYQCESGISGSKIESVKT